MQRYAMTHSPFNIILFTHSLWVYNTSGLTIDYANKIVIWLTKPSTCNIQLTKCEANHI